MNDFATSDMYKLWGVIEFDGQAVTWNGAYADWDYLDAEHFGWSEDDVMREILGADDEDILFDYPEDRDDFYSDCL